MRLALETPPFAPTSHSIWTSRRASFARHQLSATTATKLSSGTTLTMPRRPSTLPASTDFTLPPNTGHCAIAAYIIPGSCTSMPYTCLPITVSGMSTRLTDLPISFQSLGALSFTFFGGSSFAAAPATLPKLSLRLLGEWVMTLSAAEHSRAVAPPRRKYSCELRIVRLPTEAMSPHARLRLTFGFAEAYSILTFSQSHSSSSATSIGAEVMLQHDLRADA